MPILNDAFSYKQLSSIVSLSDTLNITARDINGSLEEVANALANKTESEVSTQLFKDYYPLSPRGYENYIEYVDLESSRVAVIRSFIEQSGFGTQSGYVTYVVKKPKIDTFWIVSYSPLLYDGLLDTREEQFNKYYNRDLSEFKYIENVIIKGLEPIELSLIQEILFEPCNSVTFLVSEITVDNMPLCRFTARYIDPNLTLDFPKSLAVNSVGANSVYISSSIYNLHVTLTDFFESNKSLEDIANSSSYGSSDIAVPPNNYPLQQPTTFINIENSIEYKTFDGYRTAILKAIEPTNTYRRTNLLYIVEVPFEDKVSYLYIKSNDKHTIAVEAIENVIIPSLKIVEQ